MPESMPIDFDRPEADQAAEILLLLRLVLNDGAANEQTLAVIRRVGLRAFGISAPSMARLEALIASYGIEQAEAGAEFRSRPRAERRRLAAALLTIGRCDEALKGREGRLRGRLAALLDLEEAELK
ncbi:hypothetical protein [Chelativorans sp. YIM 93263]|uniref:hypothetical protein n=1 Tax=Chelativorans sp. YIM 93263 TaxID=2906648 RepID=UPI00237949B7|nr:hypothetical protein [Chelativorans sp. YIM 93263]